MIPVRLIDTTTIFARHNKKHTFYTHLFCVLLRTLLGLLIYFKIGIFKSYKLITIFYILVIILFSNKLLITHNKTWKVYMRTIIFYILSIIINSAEYKIFNKQPKNVTGLFVIFDAILGMQSRHIQSNFLN